MKVCFAYSLFGMGGIERSIQLLTNQLEQNGISTLIWSRSSEKSFFDMRDRLFFGGEEPSKIKKTIEKARKLFQISKNHQINVTDFFSYFIDPMIDFLKSKEINVLVCNDTNFISMIPYIKNQMPTLKIVAWTHVEVTKLIVDVSKAFYLNDYVSGLQAADAVVVLNSTDKAVLSAFDVNAEIIHNGIVLPGIEDLSARNNTQIAFTARADVAKGLEDLGHLSANPNFKWHISVAGFSREEFTNLTHGEFENTIVPANISFLGSLKGDELKRNYQSSSIILSLSYFEGMSLALLEGMSYGLIPVSYAHAGAKEIMTGELAKLISPIHDLQGIEKSLKCLEKNSSELEFLSKLARHRAEDFTVEIFSNKWTHLLNKL
ncbi:glycosyltransferase [Lacticaseibacillus paracasei]|uniref:glycosyltransferase n=1 Tax=Lacticaseibacillus paracasei TaxID=1597 RepID=UPI001CBE5C86|nr:glycosyltransferase [Lacticaseibacillus paracasei]MBZ3797545.1 glycosyltransferase [Lacticaseibacillus paracasei]